MAKSFRKVQVEKEPKGGGRSYRFVGPRMGRVDFNGNVQRGGVLVDVNQLPDDERRVQVAAARLRVTLDERLKRTTPPEVKALAKEAL